MSTTKNEDIKAIVENAQKETNAIKPLEKDPRVFFDGIRFVPKRLADYIMGRETFRTTRDNETIFLYSGGVYKDVAEPRIKELALTLLGESSSKNRILETVNHVRVSNYIDRNEAPIHLINVKNGMFNITTCELEPHNPNIFTVSQIPVKFEPDADCLKIKEFVRSLVDDEHLPIIQELFGYCLYRRYFIQKAFMFLGDRDAGKSTLMNLFTAFLGKRNTSNVPLQDFAKDRFASALLYGKHANIVADLSDEAMRNTAIFKALTGGDRIQAQKKHKDPFEYWNCAKLIFSCNSLPEVKNPEDAFFKRWQIIPFTNCFEGAARDSHILDELTSQDEMSGLLNWSIAGLTRLLKNKTFTNESSLNETKSLYLRESDSLNSYVEDRIIFDGTGSISKEDFYSEFIEYCKTKKKPVLTIAAVGRKLSLIQPLRTGKRGPKGNQKNVWLGISFKEREAVS